MAAHIDLRVVIGEMWRSIEPYQLCSPEAKYHVQYFHNSVTNSSFLIPVGTKYIRIQEIYQQYKDEAEGKFRMEWGLFKHVDDKNRNLSIDIGKQKSNKKAITNPNRNDKSLIETLQTLRNF